MRFINKAFGKNNIYLLKTILFSEFNPMLKCFPIASQAKKLTLGYTREFQMIFIGKGFGKPNS